VYFSKDPATANRWHWIAGANRGDIDVDAYGGSFGSSPSTPATQFFPVQSGYLDFTSDGLLNVENTTARALRYDLDGDGTLDDVDGDGTFSELADDFLSTPGNSAGWHFAGGATAGQSITFSFGTNISTESGTGADATTQYGGTTAGNNFPRFVNQNGFSAGDLQGVDIDDDGFVTGLFSNGQSVRLAQVALARFPNVNGLSRVGKNNFIETSTTGNPVIGSPNQQGFGAVRAGFLELSNTDLAEEFVRLILAQRSFQANTRTISTTNELLSQLVVLGQ
jgi:flagellar hook protein FlgE